MRTFSHGLGILDDSLGFSSSLNGPVKVSYLKNFRCVRHLGQNLAYIWVRNIGLFLLSFFHLIGSGSELSIIKAYLQISLSKNTVF